MKIAIASGKGGTGKTTVAVGLALTAPCNVQVVDCDVEAPNCHIFLKPEILYNEDCNVKIPELVESKCNGCGRCGEVCEFRAIALINDRPMIFAELCHSCGACVYVCPEDALKEIPRKIGTIEAGSAGNISFVHGQLNIGEAMSPPLIRAVKRKIVAELTIIDCPPGISCPVVTSVTGVDYSVLVTEPTPFGLNDLKLAVEMLKEMKIPFGVVINRAGSGDDRVKEYCEESGISILAEIPDSRNIAHAYSEGVPFINVMPEFKAHFECILKSITQSGAK